MQGEPKAGLGEHLGDALPDALRGAGDHARPALRRMCRCVGTGHASGRGHTPHGRRSARRRACLGTGTPGRPTVRFDGRVRIVVVGGGSPGWPRRIGCASWPVTGAEIVVAGAGSAGSAASCARACSPDRRWRPGAETFLSASRRRVGRARLARRVGLGDDLVHPAPVGAADRRRRRAATRSRRGTLPRHPGRPSPWTVWPRWTRRPTWTAGRPLLAPGEDIAVGALVRAAVRRRRGRPAGRSDARRRVRRPRRRAVAGRDHAGRCTAPRSASTHSAGGGAGGAGRGAATGRRAGLRQRPGGLSRLVDAVGRGGPARRSGSAPPVRELHAVPAWRLAVGRGSTREPRGRRRRGGARGAGRCRPPGCCAVSTDGRPPVGRLDYASVALVSLALPAGTALPELSGFLVPATEGFAVKAATFFSTKWPHLGGAGPPVLVRASLGPATARRRVLQRDRRGPGRAGAGRPGRAPRRAAAGAGGERGSTGGAAGCRSTASGTSTGSRRSGRRCPAAAGAGRRGVRRGGHRGLRTLGAGGAPTRSGSG